MSEIYRKPKTKQFKRKIEFFLFFVFCLCVCFYVLVVFEQKDYIGWLVKMS